MQPKISVIVPVYKAEKYLHRCVDSILAQTFTDFELLLINDGSPDNSGAICDEYAQKDCRVRVFHKENGGVNAARKDGVEASIGEWITFVDADDTLPIDALDIFHKNISKDIDIIKGCYNMVGHKQIHRYNPVILSCEEYRRETITNSFLNRAPWASLIRKRLFNNHTFKIHKELIFGEDMIMNIRLAFETNKKTQVIKEIVYNYILNSSSCVHTFTQSIDYIELWYKHITDSIPLKERTHYMNECIQFRLTYLYDILNQYITENIWQITDFHKKLKLDIKQYNYKLKFPHKLAINCHNPITCSIYLFIINLYINYFKNNESTK